MEFELIAQDAKTGARAGLIHTDHGDIETPIFMPVGTVGSVKAILQQQLTNDIKAQIILGNTYHLYLRPGTEILEKAGGLHKFNAWAKPILTDSGGFQVFSLAGRRKMKEEGVVFQSHIDGSRHLFTPEKVIDIQRSIGADIIMAFDECTPYPADYGYARESLERTQRWLLRCRAQMEATQPKYGHQQSLFPIVQGSTYPELRKRAAQYIADLDADGYAIGGVSVGEPEEAMYEMTGIVTEYLPKDKPRYLMGVGTPANLINCINLGIDMFDCVMPTRNGRNGMLFTTEGLINIKNKKWEADFSPVDEGLGDNPINLYSKAYLRHLFQAREILGLQLASLQNLSFYLYLVKQIRQHIIEGDYYEWQQKMLQTVKTRR